MPIQITNARRPEAREMSLVRRVCSSFPQVIGGGFTKRSFKSSKLPEIPLESSQSSTLTHGIHVFHCPVTLSLSSTSRYLSLCVRFESIKSCFFVWPIWSLYGSIRINYFGFIVVSIVTLNWLFCNRMRWESLPNYLIV